MTEVTFGPIAKRIAEVTKANAGKRTVEELAEWIEKIIAGYYTPTADIQGALNTAETGADLIQVARDACTAEQELAALKRKTDAA